jgi:hypothetical protein
MADQPPRPPDEEPSPGAPMPGGPPPSPVPPPGSSTPPAPVGWASPAYQPPAPPPDDITGYIRANAGRYTREALTARLAAAGHGQGDIDNAWAAVDAEDAAAGRRDRRGTVSTLVGGAYVITWLVITGLWLVGAPDQAGSVLLVSGILAFFLFIPGLIAFLVARNSRRLRRAGTGTAIAFALVPLLILGALAGTCVAIVPPTGFS